MILTEAYNNLTIQEVPAYVFRAIQSSYLI